MDHHHYTWSMQYHATNKTKSYEFMSTAEKTIEMLSKDGKFDQAARMRKEIAEFLESDKEYGEAAKEYEKAAKLYEIDDRVSFAIQCKVKAADLIIITDEPDYAKAIELYDNVISEYMKKDTLKGSAKSLMIKVWLCHLANDDLVAAQNKYTDFCSDDTSFINGREGVFVSNMLKIKESNDVDAFQKNCFQYNKITPFDKQLTKILEKVKDRLDPVKNLNLDGNDDNEDEVLKDQVPDFT